MVINTSAAMASVGITDKSIATGKGAGKRTMVVGSEARRFQELLGDELKSLH